MRVICNLARLREQAGLDIDTAAAQTGMRASVLRQLERGNVLPGDAAVAALQRVYGTPDGWYPAPVAAYLTPDVRWCEGCGDELDPDAPRGARFHDEECEQAYRLKTSATGASVEGLSKELGRLPDAPAHPSTDHRRPG